MHITKVKRTKKKIIVERVLRAPEAGDTLQFSQSAANDTGTPAKKKKAK